MDFNLLDAGLALVLVLFFVRGMLRGMVRELAGLVGIILGILCAGRFYPVLAPYVKTFINDPLWVTVLSYVGILAAVMIAVSLAALLVRKFMSLTFTAWIDHVLGAVLGAALGLLLCSLALVLLERLVPDSHFLRSSMLAGHIEQLTAIVRSHLPEFH